MAYPFEVKEALSRHLGVWYPTCRVTTKGVEEFAARGLDRAMVWAAGRMVDDATAMIESYRKNENKPVTAMSSTLPVVIAAMDKSFQFSGGEWSRTMGETVYCVIPGDPLARVFALQSYSADVRVQLLVAAAEVDTASSIITQIMRYLTTIGNRKFPATYRWAGLNLLWPCSLETTDLIVINTPPDQKNLTLLALDMTIRHTVPEFSAPRPGDPHDGLGAGTADDPHGFPGVVMITSYDSIVNRHAVITPKPPPAPAPPNHANVVRGDGEPT